MVTQLKIPTKSLPKGWKKIGAEKFGVSESMIGKVVWGQVQNDEIFDYMLDVAEQEATRLRQIAIERKNRINALTK